MSIWTTPSQIIRIKSIWQWYGCWVCVKIFLTCRIRRSEAWCFSEKKNTVQNINNHFLNETWRRLWHLALASVKVVCGETLLTLLYASAWPATLNKLTFTDKSEVGLYLSTQTCAKKKKWKAVMKVTAISHTKVLHSLLPPTWTNTRLFITPVTTSPTWLLGMNRKVQTSHSTHQRETALTEGIKMAVVWSDELKCSLKTDHLLALMSSNVKNIGPNWLLMYGPKNKKRHFTKYPLLFFKNNTILKHQQQLYLHLFKRMFYQFKTQLLTEPVINIIMWPQQNQTIVWIYMKIKKVFNCSDHETCP